MEGYAKNKERLSDRITFALELAIAQQDLELAEILNRSLEMSLTRNSGGGEFVERREYPKEIEKMLDALRKLKGR